MTEEKETGLSIINSSKLAGYVLAFGAGQTLIGRLLPKESGMRDEPVLSPVYALAVAVDPRRGAIAYQATPVLLFSSFDSIRAGKLTLKPVSELSRADQKMLEGVIENVEQQVRQMRTEEAGLVIPMRGG
jgi:hypothetical protein